MSDNNSSKYCVIQFLELPYKGIDEYVCIPSSWVRLRIEEDQRAIVSYPVENTMETERRVKQMQNYSEEWRIYMAVVKYDTDCYDDAQVFINEQIDNLHCENGTSNSMRGDHELLRKETQESKRENNLNHKMAVPQKFQVLKNYKSVTKIRLKRVKNITLFGSIESNSEGESSSSEASQSSNENQQTPTHEDYSIENYSCKQEIPVGKTTYDNRVEETTDPERSTNNMKFNILANQLLDPGTIAGNNFFTGFVKFLRDLPPSFRDIEKLSTAFNKNPEKTKELLKSVMNRRTPKSNNTTASTLKYTAEVTKIYGRKRNAVMEREDDGNCKEQIQKKRHCYQSKFVLPPEYDENDSRWTLKHRTQTPGLVELMPHTGVYVNEVKLRKCKRLANDCNALARVLSLAIFKTSALRTCSLTGARAKAYDLFGENVRPGLDENARKVILEFVKQYGSSKGWKTSNTKAILNSIRNKMRDMRRE